jgi:LPS-assembly protein
VRVQRFQADAAPFRRGRLGCRSVRNLLWFDLEDAELGAAWRFVAERTLGEARTGFAGGYELAGKLDQVGGDGFDGTGGVAEVFEDGRLAEGNLFLEGFDLFEIERRLQCGDRAAVQLLGRWLGTAEILVKAHRQAGGGDLLDRDAGLEWGVRPGGAIGRGRLYVRLRRGGCGWLFRLGWERHGLRGVGDGGFGCELLRGGPEFELGEELVLGVGDGFGVAGGNFGRGGGLADGFLGFLSEKGAVAGGVGVAFGDGGGDLVLALGEFDVEVGLGCGVSLAAAPLAMGGEALGGLLAEGRARALGDFGGVACVFRGKNLELGGAHGVQTETCFHGKSFSLKPVAFFLQVRDVQLDGVREGCSTCCRTLRPAPGNRFRSGYLFITIMLLLLRHPQGSAQQMTTKALPSREAASASSSQASGSAQEGTNALPDTPSETRYPTAYPVPVPGDTVPLTIESTGTQSYRAGVYDLDQDVVITYKDRVVRADHMMYDSNTGDVVATGHLVLTGGVTQEVIHATHGTYNLKTGSGRFYEVTGSVALKPQAGRAPAVVPADPTYASAARYVYSNGNPMLFTGRIVVKTGPMGYEIYDGTVTSCQLPKPDWLLSGAHFSADGEQVRAVNATFHLLGYPVLFLPYVTHPEDSRERESGFLIPDIGESSTKGIILGEQIYMVLGRSADLTVGADYYSSRGWAQMATFRYRGQNLDFASVHYSGLLDRGYTPVGGVYTNQGGEDLVFAGRHDFSSETRSAANVEYLSSYVYREAFTDNFNQAVTSDVVSTAYITHEHNGYETAATIDRYQGIKVIATAATAATATTPAMPGQPEQQVHIFHAPTFSLSTTDLRLGSSQLEYTLDSSASAMVRSQPRFSTNTVGRFDFRPQVALPFSLGDWRFRPSVAVRETVYTDARVTPYGPLPVETGNALSRSDFEGSFELRPPVVARTFDTKGLAKFLGDEVRHTIEPEITYRYVGGIHNFLKVLRFDENDVVSDTNEVEYGVTQRLFRHRRTLLGKDGNVRPCHVDELPQGPGLEPEAASEPVSDETPGKGCGNEELISWKVAQKYFFDPTLGGAVVNGRRNIFATTLDFSGVAFLTEPRDISPLISRLRVRTSTNTDLEWDIDMDTGAKKITGNNVFVDVHRSGAFGAFSYALLNAPGRAYVEGVNSTVSSFNQLRVLMGYGQPTRPGLSVAGNAGLDLCPVSPTQRLTTSGTTATPSAGCALIQYAALQASYNWNCCGLAMEYRKYELGSVRNEGVYRFNFTLANIGTAGNLRRAERLF